MRQRLGQIGELLVELKLTEEDWHVVRLNSRQLSANTDLIAIDGEHRISIQVKTTEGGKAHSHSNSLQLGNAAAWLTRQTPFFNSKDDPLSADIVVGVNYQPGASRFFVLPVGLAETLCRRHCEYWISVPKRDRQRRSTGFPVYLSISGDRSAHGEFHARTQRNLASYENNWGLLREPTTKLRNSKAWPLVE